MRIGIDATSVPKQPAGAGIYAIELTRALAGGRASDGYALFTRGPWPDASISARPNWRVEHVSARTRAGRFLWEQWELPRAAGRLGLDLIHSTHHTLPLRTMRARRVVTIHDVTFFRIPDRYPAARRLYMQALTRLSARVADAIIVPSRTVLDDVQRVLHVPASKLTAIYEAAAPMYAPVDPKIARDVVRAYGIDSPYVLSVGSLEPGKNRSRIVRALRFLRDTGVDCRLVIAGQPAWKSDGDDALIDRLGMRDRVSFTGYVKQEDMAALYSGAAAFVFPSLYEGFGLPVIEAMACGTPVLTSNVSATAEVAGDAALLVDPLSVEAIRDGVRRLLNDEQLRQDLKRRGRLRAAKFSWRRAADETHAVYAHVAGKERRA